MRRLLVPAVIVVISLLIGFCVSEVALRMLGIGYPLFTQADEWTGFALRPNASGWVRDEGETFIRINPQGLRDREHAKEKPEGVLRIAILGDSYAEARQLPIEQTFWAIIESELQSCPALGGKKAEVINFGVSGFGTAQELLMLPRVWEYAPDVVLLAFTTGNDIRNNSYPLEGNPDKPYFYLQQGEVVPDYSFRDRPNYLSQTSVLSRAAQWAVSHSRVLQLLNRVRSTTARREEAPATESGSLAARVKGLEAGLDADVYIPPKNVIWEDAWILTEELLKAMHRDVSGHGAKFIIATLSNGIQVHPDPAVRTEFANALNVPDLFEPDRRIALMGAEQQFTTFLLAPILQRIAEQQTMFLHGFSNTALGEGHWNENGHREAGMYLAKMVCGSL